MIACSTGPAAQDADQDYVVSITDSWTSLTAEESDGEAFAHTADLDGIRYQERTTTSREPLEFTEKIANTTEPQDDKTITDIKLELGLNSPPMRRVTTRRTILTGTSTILLTIFCPAPAMCTQTCRCKVSNTRIAKT